MQIKKLDWKYKENCHYADLDDFKYSYYIYNIDYNAYELVLIESNGNYFEDKNISFNNLADAKKYFQQHFENIITNHLT
jgi:hypothetical protein